MDEAEKILRLKSYLKQYQKSKQRLRRLGELKRELRTEIDTAAPKSPVFSLEGKGKSYSGDGAGTLVYKLDELETKIEAQRYAVLESLKNTMVIIEQLPQSSERDVLELRYISKRSWVSIARELSFSERACYYLYTTGLKKLIKRKKVLEIILPKGERE